MDLRPDKPDWTQMDPNSAEAMRERGQRMKTMGIVIAGSSVAIFFPALSMMSQRGTSPVILYILLAFWLMDMIFGLVFIVRGRKLMQQGSENNG